MSAAGGEYGTHVTGEGQDHEAPIHVPMSGVRTIPCGLSNDAFYITNPLPRPIKGQRLVKTLPSPNFVCGW